MVRSGASFSLRESACRSDRLVIVAGPHHVKEINVNRWDAKGHLAGSILHKSFFCGSSIGARKVFCKRPVLTPLT